jgi:hypothetical protein
MVKQSYLLTKILYYEIANIEINSRLYRNSVGTGSIGPVRRNIDFEKYGCYRSYSKRG